MADCVSRWRIYIDGKKYTLCEKISRYEPTGGKIIELNADYVFDDCNVTPRDPEVKKIFIPLYFRCLFIKTKQNFRVASLPTKLII